MHSRILLITRGARGLAVAAALLLLLSAPALATLQKYFSVEEMTALSTDVVHGVCTSVESAWTGDGKRIVTTVTLEVTEPLKGPARGGVAFAHLGGVVDGTAMNVVGGPSFAVGEEVVVFLRSASNLSGTYADLRLAFLSQGKWSVAPDPGTGAMKASRSTSSARLLVPEGQEAEAELSLGELTARIRAAAAAGGN